MIGNRDQMTPQMEAQSVQRSGTPDGSNYARFQQMATEIVNILAKGSSGGGSLGSSPAFQQVVSQGKAGHASGYQLLQTAVNLANANPHIPYQLGGDSPPNAPTPSVLDCSSAMQWCYFHRLSTATGHRRSSTATSCPRPASGSRRWRWS
jgi:hypothetical protein